MADIRIIDAETMDEIASFEARGKSLLGLSNELPPHEMVQAITEHVRAIKADGKSLDEDDVLAIGILLGWQYVYGLGWHWREVVWDADEENSAIGVLPKDNRLFINPMWWMNDTINTDRATNFMLNYNMILAGNVPAALTDEAIGFH